MNLRPYEPRPLMGPKHPDRMGRTTFRKYCDVCEGVTSHVMVDAVNPDSCTKTLSVTCHGSTESRTFADVDIMIADYDYLQGAVYDWLMNTFKGEEDPEVRLVVHYNQGRAMPEGERVNR